MECICQLHMDLYIMYNANSKQKGLNPVLEKQQSKPQKSISAAAVAETLPPQPHQTNHQQVVLTLFLYVNSVKELNAAKWQ